VTVAQHGRLRVARGATGEQEDGDVVGRHVGRWRHLVGADGIDLGEELVVGDELDPVDGAGPGDDRLLHYSHRRRRPGEDVPQLLVGQPVVQRDERHAGEPGAEQHDRYHVGVDVDQHRPFDPLRADPCAGPPGPVEQLAVREATRARAKGDAVPEALARHLEQHREVHEST
jgi:hypothetical protein